MLLFLARILFVLASAACGYYAAGVMAGASIQGVMIGAGAGIVVGLLIVVLESRMKSSAIRNFMAVILGLFLGLVLTSILMPIIKMCPVGAKGCGLLQLGTAVVLCYLGVALALKAKDHFSLVIPYVHFVRDDRKEQMMIMDSSAIIDGRIVNVCETGFITGKVLIPRFVVHDIQQMSDPNDEAVSERGRRGLEMLDKLKGIKGLELVLYDEGLPNIKGVEAKLIRLSKMLGCKLLTSDTAMHKAAKMENVDVLNVNDLSNALRPVVLPGEQMNVYIRKEGKERNQGVAYLDDGTMIVIDNARRLIGKSVNIAISSVLQTSAGRMIFANLMEQNESRKQNGQDRR